MLNRFDTFRLKSYNEKRRKIERYKKRNTKTKINLYGMKKFVKHEKNNDEKFFLFLFYKKLYHIKYSMAEGRKMSDSNLLS